MPSDWNIAGKPGRMVYSRQFGFGRIYATDSGIDVDFFLQGRVKYNGMAGLDADCVPVSPLSKMYQALVDFSAQAADLIPQEPPKPQQDPNR